MTGPETKQRPHSYLPDLKSIAGKRVRKFIQPNLESVAFEYIMVL